MQKKNKSRPVNLTAVGNDNIQVVGSHNLIQRITNLFLVDSQTQRAQRDREAMLKLVKTVWIKGVLENSLPYGRLIDLVLEERFMAVQQPWDAQVQMPIQPNRLLSPGTPILQVFNELNSAMLILGEPGAGKTTLLLELARHAIDSAEQDTALPIPVIFNLSSWVEPKQAFIDWLLLELVTKYNIPKKIAHQWLEQNDLLLLLDGLDEVKKEHREACLGAINNFRTEYGTAPLAVCSRTAEYEELSTRLKLHGAIVLHPLTPQQIDEYFDLAGSELRMARQTLQQDAQLQELTRQPLMLNILGLAYQNQPVKTLAGEQFNTTEARRKQLLDVYIQTMFERVARTRNEPYTPEQTKRRLAWLAQKMIRHTQPIFLLEQMQRDWLPTTRGWHWLYSTLTLLTLTIIGGLYGWLHSELFNRWIVGVVLWLLALPPEATNPLSNIAWFGLVFGWLFGLCIGIFYFLPQDADEAEVAQLKWSWRKNEAVKMLQLGAVFGLVSTVLKALFNGLDAGLWLWGLTITLVVGLPAILFNGFYQAEIKTRQTPYEGIYESIKTATVAGLIGGVVSVFYMLIMVMILGAILKGRGTGQMDLEQLLFTLQITGLSFGLFGATLVGALAIRYFVVSFVLNWAGHIPWNYVRFLDYAVERIFLHKLNGGYVFVHRIVMEHFASLASDK